MRVFIRLSYDGTHYAGWQIQPDVKTVQGTIEKELSTIYNEPVSIMGCGRTDRGVHATDYYAHADIGGAISLDQLSYKLNRMLPSDISCRRIYEMPESAHARFDATSRKYIYDLHFNKDPFVTQYSTYFPNGDKLDLTMLHKVADVIKETEEFGTFCKLHGADTHMRCDIIESYWEIGEQPSAISYHIRANRFLRGMVRLIVGSSLAVAQGQVSITELKAYIDKGTRSPLMKSAPPEGLALSEITYDHPNLD